MSSTQRGILFCLAFVTLEAFQAVYFGSTFQGVDSFLIGTWVFGISAVGCTLATAILKPAELMASARAWKVVLILNMLTALAWLTYFIAIQIIEPAVVFTIFSGMVPLGTVIGAWFGLPEAAGPRHRISQLGVALILIALLLLGAITISGQSGFVRGHAWIALIGVVFAAVSGGLTAFVFLFSVRLNRKGAGPLAQFGLRFVIYPVLAFTGYQSGLDAKDVPIETGELAIIVLIGLAVIAFPLYLVQRAVPLVPASTIAAMTALGPAFVFVMQLFDQRIEYAPATLVGLIIYMIGALISVYGTTARSNSQLQV